MLPDSPVRPQWRPSNTHAAAITHRDGVYVRKRMCICRSIRPALTNVCGRGSDSCLYILLTTGSSTFNWDNLGNDSSTTSDICYLANPDVSSLGHYSTAFFSITTILANIYSTGAC